MKQTLYQYSRIFLLATIILYGVTHINYQHEILLAVPSLWFSILITQIFVGINLILMILRTQSILSPKHISLKHTKNAILLNYGMSAFLPFRGADILRLTYLKKHENLSFNFSFCALSFEKVLDLALVCFLGIVTISQSYAQDVITNWALMSCVPFLLIVVLHKYPAIFDKFTYLLPEKLKNLSQNFMQHMRLITKLRLMLEIVFLSILVWLSALLSVYVFFYFSCAHTLPISAVMTIFVLSTLGGALPLLPAGLGVYEAAVIYVLRLYGYDFSHALFLAIGLHISQLLMSTVISIFIFSRKSTGISSLLKEVKIKTRSQLRS